MAIVHPDMMEELAGFMPDKCTIKACSVASQDGYGEEVRTYTARTGESDMACSLREHKTSRYMLQNMDMADETTPVLVVPGTPMVEASDHIVVNGVEYKVGAWVPAFAGTFTEITLSRVV